MGFKKGQSKTKNQTNNKQSGVSVSKDGQLCDTTNASYNGTIPNCLSMDQVQQIWSEMNGNNLKTHAKYIAAGEGCNPPSWKSNCGTTGCMTGGSDVLGPWQISEGTWATNPTCGPNAVGCKGNDPMNDPCCQAKIAKCIIQNVCSGTDQYNPRGEFVNFGNVNPQNPSSSNPTFCTSQWTGQQETQNPKYYLDKGINWPDN